MINFSPFTSSSEYYQLVSNTNSIPELVKLRTRFIHWKLENKNKIINRIAIKILFPSEELIAEIDKKIVSKVKKGLETCSINENHLIMLGCGEFVIEAEQFIHQFTLNKGTCEDLNNGLTILRDRFGILLGNIITGELELDLIESILFSAHTSIHLFSIHFHQIEPQGIGHEAFTYTNFYGALQKITEIE